MAHVTIITFVFKTLMHLTFDMKPTTFPLAPMVQLAAICSPTVTVDGMHTIVMQISTLYALWMTITQPYDDWKDMIYSREQFLWELQCGSNPFEVKGYILFHHGGDVNGVVMLGGWDVKVLGDGHMCHPFYKCLGGSCWSCCMFSHHSVVV
jgi:hypothetical protein